MVKNQNCIIFQNIVPSRFEFLKSVTILLLASDFWGHDAQKLLVNESFWVKIGQKLTEWETK